MATAPTATDRSADATAMVTVRSANIYIAYDVCRRFIPDIESVAVVLRDGSIHIVPLIRGSAGGTLLKLRNRSGDRVIHAQEFFREHGYAEDTVPQQVAAQWSASAAALVLGDVRSIAPHAN